MTTTEQKYLKVLALNETPDVIALPRAVIASLDETQFAGYEARATRAARDYAFGRVAKWTWVKHETEWKNGRARTRTAACVIVRARSVAQIFGRTYLAYDLAGKSGVARAPRGYRWCVAAGKVTLTRRGDTRPVRVEDLMLGLYDGVSGSSALPLPSDLVEEFGAFEFGASALVEVARKIDIVRDRRVQARRTQRTARAVRLLVRSRRLTARLTDARALGFCMPGISAWAQQRGVDLDAAVPRALLAQDADERAQCAARGVATQAWEGRALAAKGASE